MTAFAFAQQRDDGNAGHATNRMYLSRTHVPSVLRVGSIYLNQPPCMRQAYVVSLRAGTRAGCSN